MKSKSWLMVYQELEKLENKTLAAWTNADKARWVELQRALSREESDLAEELLTDAIADGELDEDDASEFVTHIRVNKTKD